MKIKFEGGKNLHPLILRQRYSQYAIYHIRLIIRQKIIIIHSVRLNEVKCSEVKCSGMSIHSLSGSLTALAARNHSFILPGGSLEKLKTV